MYGGTVAGGMGRCCDTAGDRPVDRLAAVLAATLSWVVSRCFACRPAFGGIADCHWVLVWPVALNAVVGAVLMNNNGG